ncbi:MAG: glutamine synthetase type III, partial [Clostridia bacterium]|nr:glutamine synthetase type III [Clostridia bacterium]
GAKAPKGQELDDHYFGTIKSRVAAFMQELNEELWKLGILAKTEHNEVAPAQHELAPIYTTTNVATDHNQLTMEIMQKVAARHGLVCLLHEKPFAGVNGSGKHNNWSIATDGGQNLLSPGDTPYENAQFLLFLCAVIKAVDDYQDLLRISVATAGNDHRLGANEAPPAVISIFLGDELNAVLEAIENDKPYEGAQKTQMKLGVDVLPKFNRDTTDRNRTSPFAFTGNKFEFRMLGSANSIASANIVLNTAIAESLKSYADRLENVEDFEEALHALIKKTIKDHKRIIFNGNGYDDAWINEAQARGLLNLRTTPDCLPCLLSEKNVRLFENHKVFSRGELEARYEIYLENYCKTVNIEAVTALMMLNKEILPAISAFVKQLTETAAAKTAVLGPACCEYELSTAATLANLCNEIYAGQNELEALLETAHTSENKEQEAALFKDRILPLMESVRAKADTAETLTPADRWPYPSYADLLFSVQ